MDLSADSAAYTITIVQKVAKAIQKALGAEGIVLMQLNGSKAGQTVPHIHFHLIPSSVHELGRHATTMGDSEKINQLAEKIRAALN
jgi:histidine triad (HIT) family protein